MSLSQAATLAQLRKLARERPHDRALQQVLGLLVSRAHGSLGPPVGSALSGADDGGEQLAAMLDQLLRAAASPRRAAQGNRFASAPRGSEREPRPVSLAEGAERAEGGWPVLGGRVAITPSLSGSGLRGGHRLSFGATPARDAASAAPAPPSAARPASPPHARAAPGSSAAEANAPLYAAAAAARALADAAGAASAGGARAGAELASGARAALPLIAAAAQLAAALAAALRAPDADAARVGATAAELRARAAECEAALFALTCADAAGAAARRTANSASLGFGLSELAPRLARALAAEAARPADRGVKHRSGFEAEGGGERLRAEEAAEAVADGARLCAERLGVLQGAIAEAEEEAEAAHAARAADGSALLRRLARTEDELGAARQEAAAERARAVRLRAELGAARAAGELHSRRAEVALRLAAGQADDQADAARAGGGAGGAAGSARAASRAELLAALVAHTARAEAAEAEGAALRAALGRAQAEAAALGGAPRGARGAGGEVDEEEGERRTAAGAHGDTRSPPAKAAAATAADAGGGSSPEGRELGAELAASKVALAQMAADVAELRAQLGRARVEAAAHRPAMPVGSRAHADSLGSGERPVAKGAGLFGFSRGKGRSAASSVGSAGAPSPQFGGRN